MSCVFGGVTTLSRMETKQQKLRKRPHNLSYSSFILTFIPRSPPRPHASLQSTEEVDQSFMEFSGFFHVAGVARPFQLQHRVMGELYQVLVGLGPQVCVQSSKDDQSGSLRKSTEGWGRRRWGGGVLLNLHT